MRAGSKGNRWCPHVPALYALTRHEALNDLQDQLRDEEAFPRRRLCRCLPDRIRELYDQLYELLLDDAAALESFDGESLQRGA